MIAAARVVDIEVVAVFVGLVLTQGAAIWQLGSLKADLVRDLSQTVEITHAGLDDRAASQLIRVQAQIGSVIPQPGEAFDPLKSVFDPNQLLIPVNKYRDVLQAKKKLRSRFQRLLRIGPRMIAALVPSVVFTGASGLYYTGFNRARGIGQWSLALAGVCVIVCVVMLAQYVFLRDRLARAGILASEVLDGD